MDGFNKRLPNFLLGNVATGSGTKRPVRVLRGIVHAQYQYRQFLMLQVNVAHKVKAIGTVKREIGNDQIGTMGTNCL